MSEPAKLAATVEGLNRLLSDNLGPELLRQEAAIEEFLREARQARAQLRAVMDRTEAELATPFDILDQGLDQAEALLQSRVDPVLEAATSPIVELFQLEIGKAGIGVEDTRQRFAGIQKALLEAHKASEGATAEVGRGVEQVLQQVAKACESLDQAVQLAAGRLEGATDHVGTAVTALEGSLGEFKQLVEERLDALRSHSDTCMQEADTRIAQMRDDVSRGMDDFCGNAEEVLDSLAVVAEKVSALFDGETGKLLGKVQDLLQVIEQIRPLLEAVEQWT